MGLFISKEKCCNLAPKRKKKKPRNKVKPESRRNNKARRASSSSLIELVKDVNSFLRSRDSSTIRKYLGNYFTIASRRERIEFAHGEKGENITNPALLDVSTDDFEYSKLLGTGGFGAVFKARKKSTGVYYALKVQPMESMARSTKSNGKAIEDETAIHIERSVFACCREHPFITNMEYAFHNEKYAIMALEYIPGGNMSILISNSPERRLSFDLCKLYTVQLVLALNFMHSKGIIYRDLKPSNILITLKGHLKLTDFGLAGSMVKHRRKNQRGWSEEQQLDQNWIENEGMEEQPASYEEVTLSTEEIISSSSESHEDPEISNPEPYHDGSKELGDNDNKQIDESAKNEQNIRWVRRRTVCGTAGYRPPEQVRERYTAYSSRNGYDERADWFSLGVCCFTMMTGRRPFPTRKELLAQSNNSTNINKNGKRNHHSSKEKHKNRKVENNNSDEETLSKRVLEDAEFQCLMYEVNYSSELFAMNAHAKDFVESLLSRNPQDRPRYDGIQNHPWLQQEPFNEKEILEQGDKRIPLWVKDHTYLQSMDSTETATRRASSTAHASIAEYSNHYRYLAKPPRRRTLVDCIEDLCSDRFERRSSSYMDKFVTKWTCNSHPNTIELFRHWNYISDDAIQLELQSMETKKSAKLRKQKKINK